ncbi:MAG: succinate dehydrogenase, hydrophobic membrane anchor protein [Dongiaceae bacterium]
MAGSNAPLRSGLGRVRGLGSAKEGVGHWWSQRLTGLALVPLGLWLAISLVAHVGLDRAGAVAWLSQPLTVGLLGLTIVATFHHAALGLQVVVEDYVHREGVKLAVLILLRAACWGLAAAALVALLFIAFRG